jgi:hypothetical protein
MSPSQLPGAGEIQQGIRNPLDSRSIRCSREIRVPIIELREVNVELMSRRSTHETHDLVQSKRILASRRKKQKQRALCIGLVTQDIIARR